MARKFWMVCGSGTSVVRYKTQAKAREEAARLTEVEPERTIYVLEAIAAVKKQSFVWTELDRESGTRNISEF